MRSLFCVIALIPLLALPACSHDEGENSGITAAPHIRVRLIDSTDRVLLAASGNVRASSETEPDGRLLGFPSGASAALTLSGGVWHLGNATFTGATLTLQPMSPMHIGAAAYRG